MDLIALNQKFGIEGHLHFSAGEGGLPVAVINNSYANAVISLYGAQVLSFKPHGQEELLWMSSKSIFKETKAIRGGIPLCFPWFGKHATDPSLPQHGFARLSYWEIAETVVLENGATEIRLQLHHSPATKKLWPFDFSAMLTVIVDEKLQVKLRVVNTDDKAFTYSDALHTYLHISDISNIAIEGLYHTPYYDGFGDTPTKQEAVLLTISKEENRRYVEHTADCEVEDKGYNRKIRVSKTGSKVTVVWNPGIETTKTMGDMTTDGYQTFICIEAANSYDDIITLAPNQSFTISTTIGLEGTPKK